MQAPGAWAAIAQRVSSRSELHAGEWQRSRPEYIAAGRTSAVARNSGAAAGAGSLRDPTSVKVTGFALVDENGQLSAVAAAPGARDGDICRQIAALRSGATKP